MGTGVGLWRRGLQDLAAAGIDVSYAQQEVLTNGGEVLIIESLPDPMYHFFRYDNPPLSAYDTHGDQVMVASVVMSYPVDEDAPTCFKRPAFTRTMGDLVAGEHHPHWRYWPSYTGERAEEPTIEVFENRTDELVVARLWCGIPISEIGMDLAERVVLGCDQRIQQTPYSVVESLVYSIDCEGIPDFDHVLSEEELAEKTAWDEEGDPDGNELWDEDRVATYKELLELAKIGVWDVPNQYWGARYLNYPPMETVLERDREALLIWQELVATSSVYSQRAYEAVLLNQEAYPAHERTYDPWQ